MTNELKRSNSPPHPLLAEVVLEREREASVVTHLLSFLKTILYIVLYILRGICGIVCGNLSQIYHILEQDFKACRSFLYGFELTWQKRTWKDRVFISNKMVFIQSLA